MKFYYIFYKTVLYCAIENESIEIIKLFLTYKTLEINYGYIFLYF